MHIVGIPENSLMISAVAIALLSGPWLSSEERYLEVIESGRGVQSYLQIGLYPTPHRTGSRNIRQPYKVCDRGETLCKSNLRCVP